MKITLNKKILISILLVFALLFVIHPCSVKAVLQSKDGTGAKKTPAQWLLQIRQMQSAGGTLGLGDTINATGLTSNNKDLDIHMEKNTEYGALAILSASSYGNPNIIADGGTTTGNNTGAVMHINKEWVSACVSESVSTTYLNNPKGRYINNDYGNVAGGKYHAGDALDIGGWHSSGATTWLTTADYASYVAGISVLTRSYSGSIFSYYGSAANHGSAYYTNTYTSRACIVIGSGI